MTTIDEIKYGGMTRIAGQSEEAAMDVLADCGKDRAFVSSVERGTAIVHGAVSVTTSPTALRVGAGDATNRRSLLIQNRGTQPIFVGGATVSTLTGIEIEIGTSMNVPLGEAQTLYGVAASGTHDVRVMEVS
jgi:hypothetical protein